METARTHRLQMGSVARSKVQFSAAPIQEAAKHVALVSAVNGCVRLSPPLAEVAIEMVKT
jgi:hypothetical protein